MKSGVSINKLLNYIQHDCFKFTLNLIMYFYSTGQL